MTGQRQFVLGLLFLVALALLASYTLFLTDFKLFRDVYPFTVHFPEAGGLRKGDAVLVAGIRSGKVSSLTFDPTAPDDRRVTVQLTLDEPLVLREGHTIEIASATVLGGHVVAVDPGRGDAVPTPEGAALIGTVAPDALAGLSNLVADNRERIDAILESATTASADLQSLLSGLRAGEGLLGRVLTDPELADEGGETIARVSATFENLELLSDRVVAGEGVIGKLFTDEELVDATQRIAVNLAEVSEELRQVTADVRGGRGLVGRMMRDDASGENLAQAIESLRSIVGRINAGEGTLGALVSDDELYRNVTDVTRGVKDGQGTVGRLLTDSAIADDIEVITHRLAEGEGTAGKLLTDEELYTRLNSASDSLSEILVAIREERGTVGRLVMDDELYEEVKRALSIVTGSLEEYREVAPISSFSQVVFGAF